MFNIGGQRAEAKVELIPGKQAGGKGEDPSFFRVRVDGGYWNGKRRVEVIGSVRKTQRGWATFGLFLFTLAVEPVYFPSKEEASMALAKAWIERFREAYVSRQERESLAGRFPELARRAAQAAVPAAYRHRH